MGASLRVGVVQMRSSADKAANLELAERLVGLAASRGAEIVVLPEKWNAIGSADVFRGNAETLATGETPRAMADWARRLGVGIIGGSISERRVGSDRLANTCLVFSPEGEVLAVYRKIHAFDVEVGGRRYRESDTDDPGGEIVSCELCGWRTGLSICYDVRFPELYRILALRGCRVVAVPADFTFFTGKDHWELLLRARAVENQYFVAAAAQWGARDEGTVAFGRSMIVDPWGVILAQAPDEDCAFVAELDTAAVERVRAALPSLQNRRPDAYEWQCEVSDSLR